MIFFLDHVASFSPPVHLRRCAVSSGNLIPSFKILFLLFMNVRRVNSIPNKLDRIQSRRRLKYNTVEYFVSMMPLLVIDRPSSWPPKCLQLQNLKYSQQKVIFFYHLLTNRIVMWTSDVLCIITGVTCEACLFGLTEKSDGRLTISADLIIDQLTNRLRDI